MVSRQPNTEYFSPGIFGISAYFPTRDVPGKRTKDSRGVKSRSVRANLARMSHQVHFRHVFGGRAAASRGLKKDQRRDGDGRRIYFYGRGKQTAGRGPIVHPAGPGRRDPLPGPRSFSYSMAVIFLATLLSCNDRPTRRRRSLRAQKQDEIALVHRGPNLTREGRAVARRKQKQKARRTTCVV